MENREHLLEQFYVAEDEYGGFSMSLVHKDVLSLGWHATGLAKREEACKGSCVSMMFCVVNICVRLKICLMKAVDDVLQLNEREMQVPFQTDEVGLFFFGFVVCCFLICVGV